MDPEKGPLSERKSILQTIIFWDPTFQFVKFLLVEKCETDAWLIFQMLTWELPPNCKTCPALFGPLFVLRSSTVVAHQVFTRVTLVFKGDGHKNPKQNGTLKRTLCTSKEAANKTI